MEVKHETKFTEVSIHDINDGDCMFIAVNCKYDNKEAQFFFDCYEDELLRKCQSIFPKKFAPRLEDWSILIDLGHKSYKILALDVVHQIKRFEKEYENKTNPGYFSGMD